MTLIIAGSVASIPEDLKAAARTLGANRPTTFFRIELPLGLPGITAATLLVFVSSTGAFAVPYLLGPIYPKPLSVWMYEEAMQKNNWGLASAMGIVMPIRAADKCRNRFSECGRLLPSRPLAPGAPSQLTSVPAVLGRQQSGFCKR